MAQPGGQKALSPSEAAARLPALIDRVTENPGETVVIDLQDERGTAVLVDSAYYELMELRAKLVDDREPFRFPGSTGMLASDGNSDGGIADEP